MKMNENFQTWLVKFLNETQSQVNTCQAMGLGLGLIGTLNLA